MAQKIYKVRMNSGEVYQVKAPNKTTARKLLNHRLSISKKKHELPSYIKIEKFLN